MQNKVTLIYASQSKGAARKLILDNKHSQNHLAPTARPKGKEAISTGSRCGCCFFEWAFHHINSGIDLLSVYCLLKENGTKIIGDFRLT